MKLPLATLCLVIAATIVSLARAADTEAVKMDLAKFQGEWAMVTGSADGQAMPEAMLATAKRVCKDDETSVTIGGQLIMKAKFTIDPSQKPKTIDYQVIDGPTKGASTWASTNSTASGSNSASARPTHRGLPNSSASPATAARTPSGSGTPLSRNNSTAHFFFTVTAYTNKFRSYSFSL